MCWFCDDVKKLVNTSIVTYAGMRELHGLKYCPNCGEKIEDFDNCASNKNDKISCEIEKLKRDVKDLKKDHDDIVDLYERLAKGGIECSMTVDDENGIRTIYCRGIE